VAVNVNRFDGFDLPIEVLAEHLPSGITATPAMVDRGELSGFLALTAEASAPAFSPPTWRVIARAATVPSGTERTVPPVQEIDPGGPGGGWITVTPEPNLKIAAQPTRVGARHPAGTGSRHQKI
jgi:hypothetical protein